MREGLLTIHDRRVSSSGDVEYLVSMGRRKQPCWVSTANADSTMVDAVNAYDRRHLDPFVFDYTVTCGSRPGLVKVHFVGYGAAFDIEGTLDEVRETEYLGKCVSSTLCACGVRGCIGHSFALGDHILHTRKRFQDNYNDHSKENDPGKLLMNQTLIEMAGFLDLPIDQQELLCLDGVFAGTTRHWVASGGLIENCMTVSKSVEFAGGNTRAYTGTLHSYLAESDAEFDVVMLDYCSILSPSIKADIDLLFHSNALATKAIVGITLCSRRSTKFEVGWLWDTRNAVLNIAERNGYSARIICAPLVNGHVFTVFFKVVRLRQQGYGREHKRRRLARDEMTWFF